MSRIEPLHKTLERAVQFIFGSRSDWHLNRPRRPRIRPGLHLLGPAAIAASVLISWPAFAGATGEDGNVALGLWVGAASIILMAWSFVLAVRLRGMERIFGGLDSMYRVHRWSGSLAVVLMFLHTSIEPEIEGGIRGASKSIADSAEDLAGTGEMMIYILVGLSLARIFPYRIWRLTHKLLGVPFAFASWHFYTSEKPYANGSAWGWWFGFWMTAGIAAYTARVIWRDMAAPGNGYRVVAAEHSDLMTRLELEPVGSPIDQKLGQFVFIKLQGAGMSEPHPFTVASGPERKNLVFYIRHLGDWSQRLPTIDLLETPATVEGPYGHFQPLPPKGKPALWIAGGVGITPFLAALDSTTRSEPTPTLLYAVRSTDKNPILDVLAEVERQGRVALRLFTTNSGRITPDVLNDLYPNGLAGHHVALCGPSQLVSTMSAAAIALGANRVEVEDFDMRQGFGPERSTEIEPLLRQASKSLPAAPNRTR